MVRIPSKQSNIASFEALVRKVKETFVLGRKSIQQDVVHTYWRTGKYIHDHILHNQFRANYAEKVIPRLSKHARVSERSLREILQVYREFPEARDLHPELSWTQLRQLSTIPAGKLRNEFIHRIKEGKWGTRQLQFKINEEIHFEKDAEYSVNGKSEDYSLITRPKLGLLYTYRFIHSAEDQDELKIDQGFRIYKKEFDQQGKFKIGEIIESERKEDGSYRAVKSNRNDQDLFTYKAFVERVVDGDTLLVEIDLGFANATKQYLRLRTVDAPEIEMAKGRKARDFVISLLKPAPFIILTSTRSEKFGRFLADVFIPGKAFLRQWSSGIAELDPIADLLYLNNELLKSKLAIRI